MPLPNEGDALPARLELRDLKLVEAICAEGSLTRASSRLHVTQPALSRHLTTLEARVGMSLFVRRGLRMHPTAGGELLLRRAREVLDQVRQAEVDLRELLKSPTRRLRIGVDCYTGYHWLPSMLNRYTARNPDVDVQIAFDAVGDPARQLHSGAIDVALVTDGKVHKGCVARNLFVDEYIAVVAPSHRLAARTFVLPEHLLDERVLLMSDPAHSNVMQSFLKPAGISPRMVVDVQLVGAVAALAESEFGVGMVPSWTIAPEVRAGRLVALRLGRKGYQRTWVALIEKVRARESWVADFITAMSVEGPPSALK